MGGYTSSTNRSIRCDGVIKLKECKNCKHFNKLYSKHEDETLKYEGVGRCLSEKSNQSGYIGADFRSCSKFLAKKVK